MTEALQVRMEHVSVIAFQITKRKFRQPIASKISPVIQVRTACSSYEANPHGLFDR